MPPVARPSGPLTHDELREQLHYDPETGHFTWIVSKPRIRPGARAGNPGKGGYWVVTICGKEYKAHRLAWFWMTGTWPEHIVDHRNRIRDDNRWENLRPATPGQSMANTERYGPGRCISSYESKRKGTRYTLRFRHPDFPVKKTFDTFEEARTEYRRLAVLVWGEEYVVS